MSAVSRSTSDGRVGLAHETFTLHLDKVLKYKDGPKELDCQFTYYYDFVRGLGLAHLTGVDGGTGVPLPITLNPAGIEGTLSFIGSNWDTPVQIPGGDPIIFYRVWLIINLKTGARSASVMLDPQGDTIITTQNDTDTAVVKALAQRDPVSNK